MMRLYGVLVAGALLLSGCVGEHIQSALHPAGPAAAEIAWLWWFMFYVLTAVFIVVVVLFAIAILRPRSEQPLLGDRFIVVSGIVLPSVILLVLLFFSVQSSVVLMRPAEGIPIRVNGHLWWWEVHYPDHDIRTANEIHIPVGKPVLLELTSEDVIHSFWVPNLSGKMDLVPGHTNLFSIEADKPGIYRGQCAEFCGLQHALMAFVVVALPPEEFEAWLADKQQPVPEPSTPELARGQAVYFAAGCDNCHSIRGIDDGARIGPDLTHIGSRLTIGAGILRNNRGNLAGWIANPQPLKPGNRMPPTYFHADELLALVHYLESLK